MELLRQVIRGGGGRCPLAFISSRSVKGNYRGYRSLFHNQQQRSKGRAAVVVPISSFYSSVLSTMEAKEAGDNSHAVPTAGIIIIGDEILKGQTMDTNSHFLTKQLHSLGVRVKRISVIPDEIQTIATEVKQFSDQYTFVLTSGGIGPTHDDITFEAVAAAFEEKVHPHPLLVGFIKAYFKTDDLTSPAMKMAHIPVSAELHFGEDKERGIKSRYPIIGVRNVTIFPGVPHLLEKAFSLLGKKLFHRPGTGLSNAVVYITADEVSIASTLNEAVAKFTSVSFGSYPKLFHSDYKTKITMESLNADDVKAAERYLRSHLENGLVIDYVEGTISSPWDHINKLLESSPSLQQPVQEALRVLSECFQKYSPEEVCMCYNGGKDCLAVLHLTYAASRFRAAWSG